MGSSRAESHKRNSTTSSPNKSIGCSTRTCRSTVKILPRPLRRRWPGKLTISMTLEVTTDLSNNKLLLTKRCTLLIRWIPRSLLRPPNQSRVTLLSLRLNSSMSRSSRRSATLLLHKEVWCTKLHPHNVPPNNSSSSSTEHHNTSNNSNLWTK